ncbi:hypothetical protein FRC01_000579, partial [Tulasnella sp. 417]
MGRGARGLRELVQEQEQELQRELEQELERELEQGLEQGLGRVLERELVQGLVQGLAQGLVQELVVATAVDATVDTVVDVAVDMAVDAAVDAMVDTAMDAVVDTPVDAAVDNVMHQWVPEMIKDPAMHLQVESAILRTLQWVWKTAYGIQHDHQKQRIFISSCQLWAPLEARLSFTVKDVEWGVNGERLTLHNGNRDKLLTSDNLNGIVELAEDLRRDRKKSEFIACNADVGINRLYVHFNRRVDWNYGLYDLREQQ